MVGTSDFNAQRRAEGIEFDQEALERVLTARHMRILAGHESTIGDDGWDGDRLSRLVSKQPHGPPPRLRNTYVGHRCERAHNEDFLPKTLFPTEAGSGLLYPSRPLLKEW